MLEKLTCKILLFLLVVSQATMAKPLDLRAVLDRAAENNPTLKVAYADLKLADASLVQAGALENPELQANILWSDARRSPLQEYSLSFNIVDIFARGGRVRAAKWRREATLAKTWAKALELESSVKKAYYTVQGHIQGLEEQKVLLQLADLQAQLAQRQREAGNISELTLDGYRASFLQTKIEVYDREQALFTARQQLAKLVGDADGVATLEVDPVLADLPALMQTRASELVVQALSERGDLKAQQLEFEALQVQRGQQGLLLFDGLRLGYGYQRESDLERLQGLTVTMPLPIFSQRQGQKALLEARLEKSKAIEQELSQEVISEVKLQLVRMVNARLKVEELEKLVPLRQNILRLTQLEVNAMLKGTYDLLMARGGTSLATLTLADAKADYWRASADLELALGQGILRSSLSLPAIKESNL